MADEMDKQAIKEYNAALRTATLEAEKKAKQDKKIRQDQIKDVRDDFRVRRQQIIQDKLSEKGEQVSRGDVQGATVEGLFDYNKCHFAELKFEESNSGGESLEQEVIILNAESPSQIFVCPTNQIGLAEHLQDQIRAYVAAVGGSYLGTAPQPNRLCIGKSKDDDQWYRAVCSKEKGQDMYELMFVDYGNAEDVPRQNIMHMTAEIMKTPILANHCILQDFEDPKQSQVYEQVFGDKIQELLPPFEEIKLVVVKKLPSSGTYVVRIPQVAKSINAESLKLVPIQNSKDGLRYPDEKRENQIINEGIQTSKSKDVTSEQNANELKEKLAKEAKKRKEDQDQMKKLQEQIKTMQEMMAKLSK